MATRFMRIDLTDEARDFRPIAVEPGVPLLDRSNANSKILFRWLGGMVAEPEWEGDSVSFYVRDDHGGRLEEVAPQPASRQDLLDKGTLRNDLATLKNRIEKAKPETPTERALINAIRRTFDDLIPVVGVGDSNRTDLDSYFFRFRDVQGNWRLVWCWGYQRVDQQPAPAVVCTDSECALLFVRRPGQSPKCPACEAALATKPTKRTHRKRSALVALLLLLLGAGLWYWWTHPQRLIITPLEYAGPVGGRVEFQVEKVGLFWFWREDVTAKAVGVVLDPAVAQYDQSASSATLAGPGETTLRFHLGDLKSNATLIARVMQNPERIFIRPESVELGVGTTARLKLMGEYKDRTEVDLTAAAVWTAQSDKVVYAYNGFLEGVGPGKTTVAVRYQANPESKYLGASANVRVSKIKFKSLKLAIDPLPVGAGRASDLTIDAVAENGKAYSVLESSLLDTQLTPGYVAAVDGRRLKGRSTGHGKLAAMFDDRFSAETEFDVEVVPGLDGLVVAPEPPETLKMVVGQVTDLNVVSPSSAPIHLTSSDPQKVKVTHQNRLIARAQGNAQVEVIQAGDKATVDVTVGRATFASITIDPSPAVVPVDHTIRARVLARIKGKTEDRKVEIAPDLIGCQESPSPRYARFDPDTLALDGVYPTNPSSPQRLALRFGKHEVSAAVQVLVAPMRLRLTPPGPIDLPLGQQMRLAGLATYSGGHRVQVLAGRMKFDSETSEKTAPGLELRGERVAALKAGGGPLSVFARYFGRRSKPVVFKSVDADPNVKLRLDVDRTIRVAGETGGVVLSATGPKGDVELVPDLAAYESSDPAVLEIHEQSGVFRAAAPGEAIVTASHAAAKEPASLRLEVFDPAKVHLVFDPPSVRVAVDEVAQLQLFLEADDGDKVQRAALVGPGVGYAMTQPQAIRWSPPTLVGLRPSAPFDLSASYYPVLSDVATAQIEVAAAVAPEKIRIVPSSLSMCAGQTRLLVLQQQLPGAANQWKEVRPTAVSWTVPPGLVWTPATEQLRPTVTVPAGASGEFDLTAEFGGKTASALLKVKEKGPDPNDPTAQVLLVREPPGKFLPVGSQQRYSIAVKKGGVEEPAAASFGRGVQWPDDFENEYVRWQAPVLTARKAGYRQWFRAEVDGRTVLFHTSTYEPAAFDRAAPRGDQPQTVEILTDLAEPVRFPVGAEFDDFRVVANYPDGFTRLVTKKATLWTPEPPESARLTASGGRLIGVRAGLTTVQAEFKGVRSQQPLAVKVLGEVDVDQIRIAPSPLALQPGETYAMELRGYKGGQPVGIITGLGSVTWTSNRPEVARVVVGGVDGASVTGVNVGDAQVTAQFRGLTSAPAQVTVGAVADGLVIDPGILRLRVGESVRIGTDLSVFRGELNVSGQCSVRPDLSGVVRYVPETRSLVGVAPGYSAVAVTFGDKLANLRVEVVPSTGVIDGQVIIEPSSGILAAGQSLPLRVYVVSPAGDRVDRTDSALLISAEPSSLAIRGNRACALAPSTSDVAVTATVPGAQSTGTAYIGVNNEAIAELIVEPPELAMVVGDLRRLRILGRAANGTHEMFPQAALQVAAAGPNPGAIQIVGSTDVDALSPGQAAVTVNWQSLSRQVPVTVTDSPLADLVIEPADATIHPGQPLVYRVTGMQGGQRRVLGPEHGVKLFVSNQEVARAAENQLGVLGVNPGQTAVIAQLGDRQVQANLNVTPNTGVVTTGPGGVVGHGYGGWYGGHGGYGWGGHGGWSGWGGPGWSQWDGGIVTGPVAGAAELRFDPEVLRLAPDSPPTGFRVIEVLADGSFGRDVTTDPNLQLAADPAGIVTVETAETGPAVRPAGQPGQTRLGATLTDADGNTLLAHPMLVSVGDVAAGPGRLVVQPDPLVIWSGETGTFGTVMLDPGGGQPLRPVDYQVVPAAGQDVVEAAGGPMVRGIRPGTALVEVRAVDPNGVELGVASSVTVEVTGADRITIAPQAVSLQIGESTPALSVMATGENGLPYQVPATLQSMDENVLASDPQLPGRFLARSLGGTQIRATYRGKEAFASVTVSGQRFVQVVEKLDRGADDFGVSLSVLAAASQNPLEYRVYAAGQPPAQAIWTSAAQTADGSQEATLHSPRMQYGPPNSLYNLIIEARDPSDNSVQQYPFTFRLRPEIERADNLMDEGRIDRPPF